MSLEAPVPAPAPLGKGAHDDVALVERCLAGERDAWVALVDRYQRLIYSVPVRLGLRAEQADEVFQDVCVRLLSRLDTLRDGRSLPRWLIVTAQRRTYDLVAHERRYVGTDDDHGDGSDSLAASDAPDAEAMFLEAERADYVRRAFELLGTRCQQLLNDLFYRDPPLSYAEISARDGRPHGSLGPTRRRCLETLRRHLATLGFR